MGKDWINVATVGCGRIYNDAHRNAYVNAASTNMVTIGLCDIRKDLVDDQLKWLKKSYEKLLKKAKMKDQDTQVEKIKFALDRLAGYADYAKMLDALEGELDLVDNCTPGRTHVPLCVQAMDHGYHAMGEKPPGLNWWDVKRLVDAEKRTGKCYQLNENVCYERAVQKMRDVIASDGLGKITDVEIHFGHGGPYVPYLFSERGLPHFIDPLWSGGGCLQDLAPHGISRALWPIGQECKVETCATKILERRQNPRVMSGKEFTSPVDDWAEATLVIHDPRTSTSFTMEVVTSWCGGFPFPFAIEGEKGALGIAKNPDSPTYDPVVFGDDGDVFYPTEKDEWDLHDSYSREVQLYCNNLLHGKPSNTPASYALRLQEILSIHYFSKLMKRKVTVQEMEDWGTSIAARHENAQGAIDAIAVEFSKSIDLK